jgi:hypothetical protein
MISPLTALEIPHPKLRRLWELWCTKRGGHIMPRRADIDVLELKEWLGHLMLIEPIDAGRDFQYRVYGTVLAEQFGRDLTGKTLSSLPSSEQEVTRAQYLRVCHKRVPLLVTLDRLIRERRTSVVMLLLPLSPDERAVNRLLIGAYPASPP